MVAAVVGVVVFVAVAALVESTTQGGCPAREDAPDGPVVDAGELGGIGTGVFGPMLTQEVCEEEGHFEMRWLYNPERVLRAALAWASLTSVR